MRYMEIGIEDMREAFSKKDATGKGWTEGLVNNEVVFDFSLTPACTIRVYSSIRNDSGLGRKVGKDAIRVAMFNPITQRGLVKVPHVKRVANWQSNLRTRIQDAVALFKSRFPVRS